MRFIFSKWSWLAVAALATGVIVAGGNFSQAWQNARSQRNMDDNESDDQPEIGPGFVLLHKCHIKLVDSVTLASDRPGVIAYMEPKEGDEVKAQQKIVGLKDEVAQAILNVAKRKAENDVQIRFANVSADVYRMGYEKNLEANKTVRGAVPFVELEKSRLEWQKAVLQGENAEFDQSIAKLKWKRRRKT